MTSLHTKYRPKKWDDVVGQDAVVASLQKALDKSHTFLFIGPSGCGKTTLARIAAKELGCDPASLQEIDAATYTGIDDMRSVTSNLLYRPMIGDVKAIIIDECHALSAQAWKALLKSLEEPPEWVYWFLCTTELSKVPMTIKTRCTTLPLKLVPTNVLQDFLADHIVRPEKLDIKAEIVKLCAQEANGSPRQAIVNLEACIGCKDKAQAVELLQSAADVPAAFQLAQALLRREGWKAVQGLLTGLKEANTNGESIRHVVRGYMTSVIVGAKDEKTAGRALEILDAFGSPFPSGDGLSPVVLACGKLCLGE